MNPGQRRAAEFSVAILAAVLVSLPGCGRRMSSALIPNRAPELEILDARADRASPTDVRVRWAARDPDGEVARCVWTITSMHRGALPSALASTAQRECLLSRPTAHRVRVAGMPHSEPDLFTIWAIDDRGAESERKSLALFDGNIAPVVTLVCPMPSAPPTPMPGTGWGLTLGEQATFTWSGVDPDGIHSNRPVRYKFKLLAGGNPEFDPTYALYDPDSLRRYYAANHWAGWDSSSSDTTTTSYTHLTRGQTYLFVVTGFDEAGDYDPVFSPSKNMLYFRVGDVSQLGPRMRVWNALIDYSYPTGGWSTDPSRVVTVEEPAGVPLKFNVSAVASPGTQPAGFRWALDSTDPSDATPRTNPEDLAHWSAWSMSPDIALGAFAPPGVKRQSHTLYIEASGGLTGCVGSPDEGWISLAIVHIVIVQATYGSELLVVDDTRLEVDQFVNGIRRPYGQRWPSSAELDTFLFARGGYPWLGTINPPTGAISRPGLFSGYSFDTLGTRGVINGQAYGAHLGTLPLSTLADYRHVIWMVDHNGAYYNAAATNPLQPMSSLHDMCTPGSLNSLAEYIALGGRVWMMGGGAAVAATRTFNNTLFFDDNDRDFPGINGMVFAGPGYAHRPGHEELTQGKMMFDDAHWRSLVMCEVTVARLNRSNSVFTNPDERWLDQPGYAYANPVHRPDYSLLPATLHVRTDPSVDPVNGEPIPPTRGPTATWWWGDPTITDVEYLVQPNPVIEDMDPGAAESPQSAMDTLMSAQGNGLVAQGIGYEPAAMTWYHGVESPEFVFTGFPIWNWRRSDCQALVDFVLQQIWHMAKAPPASSQRPRPVLEAGATRTAVPASRVGAPGWRTANR